MKEAPNFLKRIFNTERAAHVAKAVGLHESVLSTWKHGKKASRAVYVFYVIAEECWRELAVTKLPKVIKRIRERLKY